MSKILSIYLSPTGTTQKVALAIARGMGVPFEDYDLTTPKARQAFNQPHHAHIYHVVFATATHAQHVSHAQVHIYGVLDAKDDSVWLGKRSGKGARAAVARMEPIRVARQVGIDDVVQCSGDSMHLHLCVAQ